MDNINKKEFFEYLKSGSFIELRNNINIFEQNNNPVFIEKQLEKYYQELLLRYNVDTGLFKEYDLLLEGYKFSNNEKVNNFILYGKSIEEVTSFIEHGFGENEELKNILKAETSLKLTEIIIDALFKDNVYNVWLNINEMIRYNESLEEELKVLNKEKLKFYKLILEFDKIDNNKKLEIYNSLKDRNYNLIFYEDLRKLKDLSYEKIEKDMLKLEEHEEYLDNELTKQYGINIYNLIDKEYILLVRNQSKYQKTSHYVRNCYSLISNENNFIYIDLFSEKNYLYGYNKFDKNKILHVLEADSYSYSQKEKSSGFVNRIMTSKEIINADNCYSEIQIVNKKDDLKKDTYIIEKPNYMVAFDYITNDILKESKRLNIPIVIITKKQLELKNKINLQLNKNLDIYIDNIKNELIKRKIR